MQKSKKRPPSLQFKISSIYILVSLLIVAVDAVLLIGINHMSNRLDQVYQDNIALNELEASLDGVQSSMTEYLNSKTTDSLEEYYRSQQKYRDLMENLNDDITENSTDRMERNVKYMSESYLSYVDETIEAKRGRNVEKYRQHYESASQLYQYIRNFIKNLNNDKFKANSEKYSRLLKDFRFFQNVSFLVIIGLIAANAAIIISVVGELISPLKRLAVSADAVARGNFEVEELPVEAEDEVGVVTGTFNQMVISLRLYIKRLKESLDAERRLKERELMMEAHLKDARLKYLQAQINPHFLFNTLNAGAQLAMMEGADRTYDYLQKVALFYRYNMKKSSETVTIRDEVEIIDSYIYILNVRFSGDIHYEKHVDEKLLNTKMPGMVLQPIVENCVNHGIREMAGEGKIILSVYSVQDGVCISIKDNGVGMSEEKIQHILNGTYQTSEENGDSNGIAMDNIISRMRLFTGNDDVLNITSGGEGKGTEVFLYLPGGGDYV